MWGGGNEIENLQLVHKKCNLEKGSQLPFYLDDTHYRFIIKRKRKKNKKPNEHLEKFSYEKEVKKRLREHYKAVERKYAYITALDVTTI